MKKILFCMVIALSLPTWCMAKKNLVLIGDATMAQHSIANPDVRGWGEALADFFTDKVQVVNFAQAGESTRTLITKRLEKILAQCHSGDYVLLQVGQNDLRGEYGEMYYSTSEMGEQLCEIVDMLQRKKMKVILCTPIAHPFYVEDKVVNRLGSYPDVVRHVAKIKGTYLVDLEAITYAWLNEMGKENAKIFYKNVSNNTQTREYLLTPAGATEISRMVAQELVAQKIPYLKAQVQSTVVE